MKTIMGIQIYRQAMSLKIDGAILKKEIFLKITP